MNPHQAHQAHQAQYGPPHAGPSALPSGRFTTGDYLGAMFATAGRHPGATFGISLPAALVGILLAAPGVAIALLTASYTPQHVPYLLLLAAIVLGLSAPMIAVAAAQGLTIQGLATGHKIPVQEILRALSRRTGELLKLTCLLLLPMLVAALVIAGAIAGPVAGLRAMVDAGHRGSASSDTAIIYGTYYLLGLVVAIPLTIVLTVVVSLVLSYFLARLLPAAAIVLAEQRSAPAALRSSWQRSRGHSLRLMGVYVVCALVITLVVVVLGGVLAMAGILAGPLVFLTMPLGTVLSLAAALHLWGNVCGLTRLDLQRRQNPPPRPQQFPDPANAPDPSNTPGPAKADGPQWNHEPAPRRRP